MRAGKVTHFALPSSSRLSRDTDGAARPALKRSEWIPLVVGSTPALGPSVESSVSSLVSGMWLQEIGTFMYHHLLAGFKFLGGLQRPLEIKVCIAAPKSQAERAGRVARESSRLVCWGCTG